MRISIIGTGNVAAILGQLFIQKGHSITQVAGRNTMVTQKLAKEFNAVPVQSGAALTMDTDMFIICLSDAAFPEAVSGMYFKQVPVFHTSGAMTMNILKSCGENYGVLYPLQSLSKETPVPESIPFLTDGCNDYSKQFLENFAHTLSNDVHFADDDTRIRLHAGAVMVNNFTNHLYKTAKWFCDNEKVDFNLLKPLIMETAKRIMTSDPADVQTGPAVRKDNITLDKHLRLLSKYPKLRTLYMRMTDGIMND